MRSIFLCCLVLFSMMLMGCSSHPPLPGGPLADSRQVVIKLNAQLHQWVGTPYRYGGLDRNGIDCSGFVYRTFYDRFAVQLPRTTEQLTALGQRVSRDELLPGDLVFFRTGSGSSALHVGIYASNDRFIHASTRKGVTQSSLDNVYWKQAYWQARRLDF